jgi:hypothetical protein
MSMSSLNVQVPAPVGAAVENDDDATGDEPQVLVDPPGRR